jgi:hypothetical protein
MSRVVTIFLKDVRHLWPQVLVFFATAALAVVTEPTLQVSRYYFVEHWAPILEAVACWVLIVTVIHEERLIGHEQYWLTRPYTWKNLVAAKALFLAIFVSLPLLVCQYTILAAIDNVPPHWIAALLWHQVFLAIFVILPAAAFAAVTANLAQVILCVVVSFPVFLGWRYLFHASDWNGLAWIRTCSAALVILGGVAAVVILQYTRRRTGIARIVVAATAVLTTAVGCAPRWGTAFAVQRLFSRQAVGDAAVSLSVDASAVGTHPAKFLGWPPGPGVLDIPLRVVDLPPGLRLGGDWISVTLETPGAVWRSGWLTSESFRSSSEGMVWMRFSVDRDFYDRWKEVPVKLSATADLTLYRHVRDVPLDGLVSEPDGGLCGHIDRTGQLSCIGNHAGTRPTRIARGDLFIQGFRTVPHCGGLPALRRSTASAVRSTCPFHAAVFRPAGSVHPTSFRSQGHPHERSCAANTLIFYT